MSNVIPFRRARTRAQMTPRRLRSPGPCEVTLLDEHRMRRAGELLPLSSSVVITTFGGTYPILGGTDGTR